MLDDEVAVQTYLASSLAVSELVSSGTESTTKQHSSRASFYKFNFFMKAAKSSCLMPATRSAILSNNKEC